MQETQSIGIGIIGAGQRGVNCLANRIAETAAETSFRVTALCDQRTDRLAEACEQIRLAFAAQKIENTVTPHADYQALIHDPAVDLVMVTTPQDFHREPALATLTAGKKLYLDKPIAHTLEDALAIVAAEQAANAPMILGFTRRYEPPWRRAYALVQDGVIGTLHMLQIRAIIPYHRYFQRWHRRRIWSGGALNDKSSHHMDVFSWFAQSRPVQVNAFGGRRVFLPQADAPERCLDCRRECPYRAAPHRSELTADHRLILQRGRAWIDADERDRFDTCVYGPDADIKDHVSAQIRYENGVVASLFLAFFGPPAADEETLELVGDRGRIILTRHTGQLDVISDHGNHHEILDCRDAEFGSSHFGADLKLIRELRAFYAGAPPVVSATNGLTATRLVMAIHESVDRGGVTVSLNDQ